MKQAGTGLLRKDFSKVSSKIQRFISDYLTSSRAKGLVIGLSGGLDSAVALQLCANAVGTGKISALILPTTSTPDGDVSDAISHASSLGVKYQIINIDPLVESYSKALPAADDKTRGNLTARIRMSILYYLAASWNSLVIGTSDKSEIWIGYFTKYGDGGSDLMPLADLYKTQVRELAKHLAVPRGIIEKKSSPHLWPGQLAEEELGMDYNTMDPILCCLIDKKMKPQQAAKKLRISLKKVKKVESIVKASTHKRNMPPTARTT